MTVAAKLRRAKEHLAFCVDLYRPQARGGGDFLHEHPAYATSWQTYIIEGMMSEPGVTRVFGDQCLYGCEAESGSPVKKPTGFMTNAPGLGKELAMRCSGRSGNCSRPEGGTYAQCRGKTGRLAAM